MDADGLLRGRRDTFSTSFGLDLRGRCGTFSTFIDVRGSLATKVDPWTPRWTLSAPQARFAWQV